MCSVGGSRRRGGILWGDIRFFTFLIDINNMKKQRRNDNGYRKSVILHRIKKHKVCFLRRLHSRGWVKTVLDYD